MERIETASQRGRKVKRETLKAVLEQCQRALQSLDNSSYHDDGNDDDDGKAGEDEEGFSGSSSTCCPDPHADEICVLIKSRVEGREFMEKMESAQQCISFPGTTEEGSCWDMVSDGDIVDVDQDDYVVVQQEDIVDAIASFMAAYLFSLKHTKELTPDQLQQALGKTFSIKKRKGKLQKALDGSKAIYNVASWSATAVGIYQNPALLRAASTAFWTSCRVISRLF